MSLWLKRSWAFVSPYKNFTANTASIFPLWHSELWWASGVKQRGRRYLDASGMSLLNQRLTATSTLMTSVTPISRETLLTRNPEASNINLQRERRRLTGGGRQF